MLFCLQLSLKCSQVYVYLQLQLISSLLHFFKQETNYIRSCKSTGSFFFFFFLFFFWGGGREVQMYLPTTIQRNAKQPPAPCFKHFCCKALLFKHTGFLVKRKKNNNHVSIPQPVWWKEKRSKYADLQCMNIRFCLDQNHE